MEKFKKGLVSIIIPVFNREKLLTETLNSILAQSYCNWECIVVDDVSSDNSLKLAQDYAMRDNRFKVFQRPRYLRKGANSCRNFGFEQSRGEFIQWFDSDDLMMVNFLDVLVSNLVNHAAAMSIGSAEVLEMETGKREDKVISKDIMFSNEPAYMYLFENAWFQTSQVLLDRFFVQTQKTKFNITLKRNQETEFFVRMLLQCPKLVVSVDQKIVLILQHQHSISGNHRIKTISERISEDFHAYKLMYFSFKSIGKLNARAKKRFEIFFFNCIKWMKPLSVSYLKVFFFSLSSGVFEAPLVASKIFLYRNMNSIFNKNG